MPVGEDSSFGIPWLKHVGKLSLDTKVKRYGTTSHSEVASQVKGPLKWATCMAACPDRPFVAVGYGSKFEGNLIVYECKLPRQLSRSGKGAEWSNVGSTANAPAAGDVIVERASVSAPSAIFSISWIGEILVVGGSAGKIFLYKVNLPELSKGYNPAAPKTGLVQYAGKLSAPSVGGSEVLSVPLPGLQSPTTRVQDVALRPPTPTDKQSWEKLTSTAGGAAPSSSSQPQHLLALQQQQINFYDLTTAKLVASVEVGVDTLYCARWNPHYTNAQTGTVVATAGADGSIYVLDQRDGNAVSSTSAVTPLIATAHSGPVRDLQWSPFIPFYLASCGDDSCVNVWDLRFCSQPLSSIRSHFVDVGSIAWSNGHFDQLATGSCDTGWTCWQTPQRQTFVNSVWPLVQSQTFHTAMGDSAPEQGRATSEANAGSIQAAVKVIASPTHRNSYYSLSGSGSVSLWSLQPSLLELVGEYSFHPKKDPIRYEFQALIQQRDLETANNFLTYQQAQDVLTKEETLALIDSTNSPSPLALDPHWKPSAESPAQPDKSNSAAEFFCQLKDSQVGKLPPGFSTGVLQNLV